jgi:hypothetical protein
MRSRARFEPFLGAMPAEVAALTRDASAKFEDFLCQATTEQ